ncbi:MAG: hypothetical protein IIC83_07505, partial [Chloroflexi bacterium]|nr:hypothetical protein [Chloroflexota bacterium]
DVVLRANDEDENLSHLILRDRRGDEIASLECLESQLSQCTGRLKITAPDRADRTVEFSAIAVDRRQEESAPILLTIITKRKSGGGGGGGGSSSSNPTPTPIPPLVWLEKGQTTVGGTISLALSINKVPNGLSGFDLKVSVSDPNVARISEVTFPPEFDERFTQALLFPPFSEVRLFAANISQVDPVVLALITFEGLNQGVTSIEVSDNTALGIQDGSSNIMNVSITNGELTVP